MVHLIHKTTTKIVLFFLLTGLPVLLFSQSGRYLGTEKKVTDKFLKAKAEKTDFQNRIAAKIYEDVKNDYYALATKGITSDYVKIRMLEMIFNSSVLTSISGSINKPFLFFLVNKSLHKTEKEVLTLFEQYKLKAEKEEKSLSPEKRRIWLQKHNKYSKQ